MGFHIDLKTLNEDAAAYSKGADKTIEELESTKRAFNKIVTSNALYGTAGEAVSNDVNNNLNAILTSIKDEYLETAVEFAQDIKKFKAAVGESSDSAVLDEDTLNNLVNRLDTMAKDQEDLERSGKKIFASIDDIIALSIPHSTFATGYRTTKKQVKKIITDVHTFNSAKGASSQLATQLQQTNSKLNQADQYSDVGYNDGHFLDYLSDASFAAEVAERDAPIEAAIKADRQAKLDAKKAEAEWAEHHPLEAGWQNVEKIVANFWQNVQQFNDTDPKTSDFEKGLKKLTSGVLASIVEPVGGVITLIAIGLDTGIEVNDRQIGYADKYEQRDLDMKGEKIVNLFAHPIKNVEGIGEMALSTVGQGLHNLATGNLYGIGHGIGNIGSMFIPVGAIAKTGITAANGAVEGIETVSAIDKGLGAEKLATSTVKTAENAGKAADKAGKIEKSVDDAGQAALKHKRVNGPYIRNGEPYGRPTLTGKAKLWFEEQVYKRQVGSDGILRDPNTGEVIDWKPGEPRTGKVDFGHVTGKKYSEMFERYRDGEISLQELKDFQFNPDNFQLENPSANRSHLFEGG
ncbi:GH-E family nuclease [Lacticaseibacillus pantheris]|uniref:GH-E family nuclease n=1 Tax=Lacticaseibacillus pantheris TaxID=171523 RepID=UPI00265989CD|nr:GH-E family nuclease [Lacticaseibacillus pantheris]WKF84404.1 GH-E family nuclease [Lacticaseibacillus pantheris]